MLKCQKSFLNIESIQQYSEKALTSMEFLLKVLDCQFYRNGPKI